MSWIEALVNAVCIKVIGYSSQDVNSMMHQNATSLSVDIN